MSKIKANLLNFFKFKCSLHLLRLWIWTMYSENTSNVTWKWAMHKRILCCHRRRRRLQFVSHLIKQAEQRHIEMSVLIFLAASNFSLLSVCAAPTQSPLPQLTACLLLLPHCNVQRFVLWKISLLIKCKPYDKSHPYFPCQHSTILLWLCDVIHRANWRTRCAYAALCAAKQHEIFMHL